MIELSQLTIHLSTFKLWDINLKINTGEFFILLGPTGSGKTLILESIIGIVPITKGKIWINEYDMTEMPPEKRNVGIVYQDYALFPHMTVIENIRFGLSYLKGNREDHNKRIYDLMAQTGILKLAERSIAHLSGGEKQRAALVRALAVNPSILLLDEPLSALDPCFRDDIQKLLKQLHEQTGTTFLMVTHDFAEALFLGERGAILNHGKIEQMGHMNDLFKSPETPFVARFMGIKNIFEATFEGNLACIKDIELNIETEIKPHYKYIAFRGEDIYLHKSKPTDEKTINTFPVKITDIVDRGPYCELSVRMSWCELNVILTKGELITNKYYEIKNIFLTIPPLSIHAF